MPRTRKNISIGEDISHHMSVGVLALCYPADSIQTILHSCGKASQRIRDLPALFVAYYVIAMSIFPGVDTVGVLHWLLSGFQWLDVAFLRIPSKVALTKARQKMGEAPMRLLFEKYAVPMAPAPPRLAGFSIPLRVVALDGSTLALQDTSLNDEAFGRSSNQNGPAAYPMARCVFLVETASQCIIAAQLGRYNQSETALAIDVLPRLQKGMLCVADRLFSGLPLWLKAADTGAHLLWRAKTGLNLKRTSNLSDGSWLALWQGSGKDKHSSARVRVVEYRIKGTEEVIRLVTTILDEKLADATALAACYPLRWGVEMTIKECKGVLRGGAHTLRSKLPDLVRQEFWGLLLAHYASRKMMFKAAIKTGRDPASLSFTASIEIIKSSMTGHNPFISP